jgi:hypothetical protein
VQDPSQKCAGNGDGFTAKDQRFHRIGEHPQSQSERPAAFFDAGFLFAGLFRPPNRISPRTGRNANDLEWKDSAMTALVIIFASLAIAESLNHHYAMATSPARHPVVRS